MSTIDIPTRASYDKVLFDYLQRIRRLEAIPQLGHYEIKVFADENGCDGNLPTSVRIVSAGDGKFIWMIPEDLDGASLTHCAAYVSTVGSEVIRVQLRNITQSYDFLTTKIEIDAGEFTSYDSTPQPVIDPDNNVVAGGDLVAIDVDNDGGGDAEGLGVVADFTV